MRPLSLVTVAAVLAAASSGAALAQDRYSSRGVIYTPAAPSVYTAPTPQTAASQAPGPQASVTRVAYSGRMLSWPGKVAAPGLQPAPAAVAPPPPPQPQMQRQAPAQVSYAAPPPPRAAPPRAAPAARDRYASINTAPDTASRPYAAPRRETPVRAAEPAPVEQPIRQAAAPATRPMPQSPPPRAPLPQNIYAEPQPAPPMQAPAPQAMAAVDTDFQGPYPPATKEPWRRLLGPTQPAPTQGVAIPLPQAETAPAKAAPKAAKPARTAAAEAPAAPRAIQPVVAPPGFRTASSTSSARLYSVHRQFGGTPDPIKMPQQFFLDGSPDLSEPPPPPVRRIAPSPGKSTATQRAAQERSQQSPDAAS